MSLFLLLDLLHSVGFIIKGGGGITCITQDGKTFERAAVNVSVVQGVLPPSAVQAMRSR